MKLPAAISSSALVLRTLSGSRARNFALAAIAATFSTSACATNPVTGSHDVVLSSVKGERDQAGRVHQKIIQFYGLYEDQSLPDYVQLAGVLGHGIGHDVPRHPARTEARSVLMSVGAVAAAVASGSEAIAEMANIGATAWIQ